MGNDDVRHDDSDMLRYIKNGINAIFLAILLWIGKGVHDSSTDIAVLRVMLQNLQAQMAEAKAGMANRYTSVDAEKDLRIRDSSIAQLADRIGNVESITRSNRDDLERFRSVLPSYVPRGK